MLSKSEEYKRDAQLAHIRPENARIPQERDLLLQIERAFNRLVALEEWVEEQSKREAIVPPADAAITSQIDHLKAVA